MVNSIHFLGGTITWRPLAKSATGSPVSIIITQTYSWTYGVVTYTTNMIINNQLVIFQPSHIRLATTYLNCIHNCPNGSLNYTAPLIIPYCTDISAPVGTIVGQRSDIVNLTSGDDFIVAFQEWNWRPLKNNIAAPWSLASRINLTPRVDNGLYNNAPIATVMSPINIPVNHSKVINIPVSDADGDFLRCRWANISNGYDECAGACPPSSLPQNTTIYPNCTIIITGEVIGDWHAVTVMVEDFMGSSSNTPISSVPIQFLVHVVGPPSCTDPPEIVGIPLKDSCTPVTVGQTFTTQVIAINHCGPNVNISDIATLSFVGMIAGSLTSLNSTIFYKTLTWTPSASQLSYQQMCTMALDSQGVQSSQYCFKFYVSQDTLCTCPGSVCTSIVLATTTSKSNTTTWALIGTISGLVLLGALGLSCCLWCYYFRPCRTVLLKIYNKHGHPELYHIESCSDPNCRSSAAQISSPQNLSIQQENHFVCKDLDNGSSILDSIPTLSNFTISTIAWSMEHHSSEVEGNDNQWADELPKKIIRDFRNESPQRRLNGSSDKKRLKTKIVEIVPVSRVLLRRTSGQSFTADDSCLSVINNTIHSDKMDRLRHRSRRFKRDRNKIRVLRVFQVVDQ